jgi:phosphopantetheine--protein transferase-like protein
VLESHGGAAAGIPSGVLGIGIDVERLEQFSHLDESMLRRAAARWLSAGERRWCASQRSYREAILVVLSCKEAVYKAWATPGGAHELILAMRGSTASGRATSDRFAPVRLEAAWEVSRDSILTLAVAAFAGEAGSVLECFLDGAGHGPSLTREDPAVLALELDTPR